MSDLQTRLETLARRIQAVIATASRPEPPITRLEAYDLIVEEMELAGLGAPAPGSELGVSDLAEHARQAAH